MIRRDFCPRDAVSGRAALPCRTKGLFSESFVLSEISVSVVYINFPTAAVIKDNASRGRSMGVLARRSVDPGNPPNADCFNSQSNKCIKINFGSLEKTCSDLSWWFFRMIDMVFSDVGI